MEIDLTRPVPMPDPDQFEWPFGVKLVARSRDAGGRLHSRSWEVTGTVQRWFTFNPPAMDLSGPNEIVQGEPGELLVKIRPRVPLSELRAEVSPEIGTAAVMQDGSGYVLEYLSVGHVANR